MCTPHAHARAWTRLLPRVHTSLLVYTCPNGRLAGLQACALWACRLVERGACLAVGPLGVVRLLGLPLPLPHDLLHTGGCPSQIASLPRGTGPSAVRLCGWARRGSGRRRGSGPAALELQGACQGELAMLWGPCLLDGPTAPPWHVFCRSCLVPCLGSLWLQRLRPAESCERCFTRPMVSACTSIAAIVKRPPRNAQHEPPSTMCSGCRCI